MAWAFSVQLAEGSSRLADVWGERYLGALDAAAIGLSILGGVLGTWALARRWPGFLRLLRPIPGFVFAGRLAVSLVAAALATAVLFASVEAIDLHFRGDPTNPQHGLSILMVAIWYPMMWAPALSILLVWRWSIRVGSPDSC